MLYVIYIRRFYLTYDTSREGMVCSSGRTVFTCQLLYIRAPFQLGFLPSKQEAARSFPHSFKYLLPLLPIPPPPIHRPQLGFSNIPAGRKDGERERDLQYLSFPLPGSFEVLQGGRGGAELEATPDKLANPLQAQACWQVKKEGLLQSERGAKSPDSLDEKHPTSAKAPGISPLPVPGSA